MERLRRDDSSDEAFRELFHLYYRRLLGFFSKLGLDLESCRELSQETFLRVYRNRQRFRGEVSLTSWIFRIATNIYRNELRAQRAEKRRGDEVSLDGEDPQVLSTVEGGTAAATPEPLARVLSKETGEWMGRALEELPTQMRRALTMRVRHGYSVAQIAELMGLAEPTVRVHLHKAREKLRQMLAAARDAAPK